MKSNKRLLGVAIISLILISCQSIKVVQIGQLNMISNRNIDHSQNYHLIQTYVGASNEERKKSRAETIQQAIDETVQNVQGGEYIMNARIYMVMVSSEHQYYSVEGDVWGIALESISNGFKAQDTVTWQISGNWYTGVIISLKDSKTCILKCIENGVIGELKYSELAKISGTIVGASFNGFKVDDNVTWKDKDTWYTGKIISLKDNKICIVKCDANGALGELKYGELAKIK